MSHSPDPPDSDAEQTRDLPGNLTELPTEAARPTGPQIGLEPGDQVGPYRILQPIGQGGMGDVFLAEQTEPLRRRVALKVIKPGMDSRAVIARFELERQALALMSHPNIARVFDAGTTERGLPYFVMEYVKGVPITTYCDEHRLSTRDRIELFVKVCEGVQHAHQKAILHRDLKPSNILVSVEGDVATPKIIDFGVAKATSQRLTEETLFTRIGQIVGTPEYMSPEQAEAGSEDIDTRTDIYSLGVVLYQLLTGALPFESESLRKAAYSEICRIIREKEPPRPSTRLSSLGERTTAIATARRTEVRRLRSQLEGDLDWIVLKSMDKDRTRRYETANGLAMDLERHLNNEPVAAGPPTARYRLGKLVRRHRGAFLAAAAVAFVLLSTSTVSTLQWMRAERESQRARVEEEKARQVAGFLSQMLEGVGPAVARGRDTTLLREILDTTATRATDELGSQPEVEEELRRVIATTYRDLGAYGEARREAERRLQVAEATFGEGSARREMARADLGTILYSEGELEEARSILTEAAARLEADLGPDALSVLEARSGLAHTLLYLGELEQAEALCLELLPRLEATVGAEHATTVTVLHTLAQTRADLLDDAGAGEAYAQLIDVLGRLYGPDHPYTLSALGSRGWYHRLWKRHTEAEADTSRALEGMRRVLGDEHSETLVAINNLAIIYKDLERYSEAEPLYLEALETGRRVQGRNHPEMVPSLANLALFYLTMGELDEAARFAREAIEVAELALPEGHPGRGFSHGALADVEAARGGWRVAERHYRISFDILRAALPAQHPRLGILAESLAETHEALGDLEEAKRWREVAKELSDDSSG